MTVLYGAHLSRRDILEGVEQTGAQAAQVFLGSPRTWRAPPILPDKELEFWASYELPVYVHSSYLVNPASSNAAVRANTAVSLAAQFDAARAIHASGVVVHAGHASGETLQDAVSHWREVLASVDVTDVPLLIENTAGGKVALGRSLEGLELLWEGISDYSPKLCFDTCHAWTGNMLESGPAPLEAFMGLMDKLDSAGILYGLTHLNGSLDERASSRDHHSNLSDSLYPLSVAKAVAERAAVPAILETPGPLSVLKRELASLREVA